MPSPTRRILHIDADAFYASVEQRDRPELRGKPVAVGWSEQGGVVLTASYEARRYGVHSAMPSIQAKRLCPDLVFVPARMAVYKELSLAIREIFGRYTDALELVSIDEAYLDVTEPKRGPASGTLIGRAIKKEVWRETGLTVSVGVAAGKFLAKLASGMNKPDGLTVITPEDAAAILTSLPVAKIHGVGPVTAQRLHGRHIFTGGDLLGCSLGELEAHFGKLGSFLYGIVRGEDERPVRARERKSYGAERTFLPPLQREEEVLGVLAPLTEHVALYLKNAGLCARTLTLKLKDRHYQSVTRSVTPRQPVREAETMTPFVRQLLRANLDQLPVRLAGVSVSNLQKPSHVVQPELFPNSACERA